MKRSRVLAAASLVGVMSLLVGCSGAPTATQGAGAETAGGGGEGSAEGLDGVNAQLEGLDPEAREAKLVELAKAEGGTISLYTSAGTEITEPLLAAFKKKFPDLDIELYRAGSDTVLQRILQEVKAGSPAFDVVETNGPQVAALAREDALSEYDSPVEDNLVDGAEYPMWTATRLLNFHISWNTDLVKEGEQPTSWTDLADPKWAGKLAMEISDVDWFKTLYEYLENEKGMSETDIDAMFQKMAGNAAFLDGHSLMGQTLASGEYALAASNYLYVTIDLQKDGAPVAYDPIVEPLIVRPNGAGISVDPPHPAGATLLMDWMLGEGQEVLVDLGLTPARKDLNKTEGIDSIFVDIDSYLDNLDEWTTKYEDLVSAGKVVS